MNFSQLTLSVLGVTCLILFLNFHEISLPLACLEINASVFHWRNIKRAWWGKWEMHSIPTMTQTCNYVKFQTLLYIELLFYQGSFDTSWKSITCCRQYVPFKLWKCATGEKINTSILNKLLPVCTMFGTSYLHKSLRKFCKLTPNKPIPFCRTAFTTSSLSHKCWFSSAVQLARVCVVNSNCLSMSLHHPYYHHCQQQNLRRCQNSFQCSRLPARKVKLNTDFVFYLSAILFVKNRTNVWRLFAV